MKPDRNKKDIAIFTSDFELEQYIPFKLVQTELNMRKVITLETSDAAKEIASISKNEFRVIIYVAMKAPISPSNIAESIGMDRAVTTRCIASLERKILVVTERSTDDQRSKLVYLSTKGVNVCKQFVSKMQAFSDHLDAALSSKEKIQLMALLHKLLLASNEYIEEQ